MWPVTLSGRLPIVALVGRYPANWLIGRGPRRDRTAFAALFPLYHAVLRAYRVLALVSLCYPHVPDRLPTRYSPVRR